MHDVRYIRPTYGLLLPAILIVAASCVSCADEPVVKEIRLEPHDSKRDRTVPLKVYLTAAEKPSPIVLFSHGLGGSRENNAYLGRVWATAGFVAVFMQHAGSDNEVWKDLRSGERMAALKAAASAMSSRQRFFDVPFVIDQLTMWNEQADHQLHKKLDPEHIGMSGHSYGAVTTLAVAGRKYPFNRNFADDRIDAFFAMSPQPGKGVTPSKAYGHITKPVLCMTGTKDGSPIDPSVKPETRKEVFAAFPTKDKFQLVLDGAEHHAFGDSRVIGRRRRNPSHHPAIQKISLQFWRAFLMDDKEAREWLKSDAPIAETRLTDKDKWDWK